MTEQPALGRKVAGSSPATPTNFLALSKQLRAFYLKLKIQSSIQITKHIT